MSEEPAGVDLGVHAFIHELMVVINPRGPEMTDTAMLTKIFANRGIASDYRFTDDLGDHWVHHAHDVKPPYKVYFYLDDVNGQIVLERVEGVDGRAIPLKDAV